jgi:hypothetical protein
MVLEFVVVMLDVIVVVFDGEEGVLTSVRP